MKLFARSHILILLTAVTLAACHGTDKPQAAAPKAAPVNVYVVKTQNVTVTTELSGRTSPYKIAEVRPQINGIVKMRVFNEGAEVKAGQTLYMIDPAPYQAAFDSAQAGLARAQANLETLKLKADRYRELIKINAVSHQDTDDVQAALGQAIADVAMNKAAVNAARINLDYTSIKAPISGHIGISTVTAGALLTANQPAALTTIQQLDPIYVDIIQPGNELMRIKHELQSGKLKQAGEGVARVSLLLDNNTRYPLQGKLAFSDVTVNQGTDTVTLRAVFANPGHDLLPGMFVRAQLDEGVNDKGILVPQQGVTHDARGNATALVLEKDGKVALHILTLGDAVGNQWLVNSGLQAGNQLIVAGLQKIRPGAMAIAVDGPVDAAKQ
jgi:membrane fusion protein (multidrug efflux system)